MKKKVLIPLDGSNRDLISLNFLKENFDSKDTEVLLLNVGDIVYSHGIVVSHLISMEEEKAVRTLERAYELLKDYDCTKEFQFGYVDKTIVECSIDYEIDIIIMTKDARKIYIPFMGSVNCKVVKKAKCIVIVLPQV
ncbi:universal stress protein [Clostridium sardiniense]|uniref:universal stress protein n=1 Tax=Clostridium sardiniense TaxID=29369 RepID=UPI003D33BC42